MAIKRTDFSKPFAKAQKFNLFLAIICIILGTFMTIMEIEYAPSILMYGIIILPVPLIKYIIWKKKHTAIQKQQAQEAAIATAQREKEEADKKWQAEQASGNWAFPSGKFYDACVKAGYETFDTPFSRQKIYTIAKSILKNNNVSEEYYALYIGNEKDFGGELLEKRLAEGKIASAAEKKQIALEKERIAEANRLPQDGQLSKPQQEYQNLVNAVRSMYGIDKRNTMLDDAIDKLSTKISQYYEGQEAIRELGIMMANSVKQEKKKDWATLGGIASGIAGAGAGLAVASKAMAENAAIEERNRQAREAANQTMRNMYSSASSLDADISQFHNEKRLLQKYREEADSKVVLANYTTKEIMEKLTITSQVKRNSSGKALDVELTITNNFVADVPENVTVTVDGTIDAEIYCGGNLVDRICVALPVMGVTQGHKDVALGHSARYTKDGKYKVKLYPNKLWIVEA